MAVRIEKDGPVWTVIHDRPEARNAMNPASADALTAAFLEFDADKDACVAVFGRKVPAEECLTIGLCEYVTPKGGARAKAQELAREIARFPQVCVRADRRSAIRSHGLGVREALIQEWYNGREALIADGVAGAARFKAGLGRHGDFDKIR